MRGLPQGETRTISLSMTRYNSKSGEMAEWSKAPDSKSGLGQPNGGSNPSLSATFMGWAPSSQLTLARDQGQASMRMILDRVSSTNRLMAAVLTVAGTLLTPATYAAAAPDLPVIMRLTVDGWIASQG